MFVRKFEADSLDEALQSIKHELGPDAIILKTVTNKGLKGAFKKKKIEITAAVTEKNLKNKMNVDSALGEKRDDFYQNRPSFISNMISGYASNSQEPQERTDNISSRAGYGGIGGAQILGALRRIARVSSHMLLDGRPGTGNHR